LMVTVQTGPSRRERTIGSVIRAQYICLSRAGSDTGPLHTIDGVETVALVAAARTPFGRLGGGLATVSAPDLGATVCWVSMSTA